MIGALVDGEGLTWVHDVMVPLSVGRVGSNQWSESLTIEMLEVILADAILDRHPERIHVFLPAVPMG